MFGATDKTGPYVVVIRWYPGYMSAPHTYVTDRLCFVLSGTWWVNSGETFEPQATVPVPAGGFVRRVAHTPHYDGVKTGGKERAVIGIIGQAPIEFKLARSEQAAVAGGLELYFTRMPNVKFRYPFIGFRQYLYAQRGFAGSDYLPLDKN